MAIHNNFHETISTKNEVLACYKKLSFTHNKVNIYTAQTLKKNKQNNTQNVSLFPSYIQPEFFNTDTVEVVKIPQEKITGYAVLINNHENLDTLFKTEYKKSFRANILRFVNRFEDCFDASYKLFYGHISQDDYTFLMATLHNMLTNRFDQRNDSNKVLNNWEFYLSTTYNLILEKKASLFVIYQNTTPVHICINHHFNNILFVSVPSYNINYAKFALGNVSLYKLLEWSVNNKYEIMDMAQGYLEYKRRWSNLIYTFEHHIVFNKSNLKSKLDAAIEIKKLNFKNYLKSKNIDELIETIKKRLKNSNASVEVLNYSFEDLKQQNTDNLIAIKQGTSKYNELVKPINDFLYTNKAHINNIRIFETTKTNEFLFCSANTIQKLTIK
ncbi:GNAT family N-acetyltransferase [Mariniflexile jejuense]|uniref:GNAT family N-acetyltransferase n=1 Tax=Mariniflexile jejuense TaxID=1173582 RepID=A0ABW3JE95_9FLAO